MIDELCFESCSIMMKISEIAHRINAHLERFENDSKINAVNDWGTTPYWNSSAVDARRYVTITYVLYQGNDSLSKADALKYLEWLDEGNVGKHWEALAENDHKHS